MIGQEFKNIIKEKHKNDEKQLEVIFGGDKRILVEAPAGYGKTRTMISKLSYIIAKQQLPNPKKILALTFSVNAAFKIKKEVNETIPILLGKENHNLVDINKKIYVSNYHGFCRMILRKYGYLFNSNLKDIKSLYSINDDVVEYLTNLDIGLSFAEAQKVVDFSEAIKNRNTSYIKKNLNHYLNKVSDNFLPNGYIPFNAILIIVFKIFNDYPEVLKFYQKYYSHIIVDEFQDTNVISWSLLKKLINEDHNLILMGDPLQRIYGFIGAIPGLLTIAKDKLNLKRINLETNHRFVGNRKLLQLDSNIRKNAENPSAPQISEDIDVNVHFAENQEKEANWIYQQIISLREKNEDPDIAVLVKQRGKNTNKILEIFDSNNLNYFYALFGEEDYQYKQFHKECRNEFHKLLESYNGKFNKFIQKRFISKIKELREKNQIYNSLYFLLNAFLNEVVDKYSFLTMEEKADLILDVLENNSLKQQIEYVNKNIIISTVHGAKGLEWDYVILPDMEQYSFPNYPGLCGICNYKCNINVGNKCIIDWDKTDNHFERNFLEELSVFYVAVTRARKDLFFSYSDIRLSYNGVKNAYQSCFLNLKGINPLEDI